MITRPEESYRPWCVVVCDLGKTTFVNEEAKAHQGVIAPRKNIEIYCVDHSRKADKWATLISHQANNTNLLVADLAAANKVHYRRLIVTVNEFGLAVTCEKTECEFVLLQKNAE